MSSYLNIHNISTLESTILKGLIHNETYTRRGHFRTLRMLLRIVRARHTIVSIPEHFSEYDSCASTDSLRIAVESLENLNEEEFRELGESFGQLFEDLSVNTDWLIDETEKWCKEEAVSSH